jgi:ATP-dependent exoDNAse (exonuclease V) alpha subunit
MAHFSVHVGTVQRGKGENAIACAAYISRSKLDFYATDKATNITVALTWDYSKKGGLSYSKIYAPEHAASWVYEREKLWNKAEQAENRWNSNTAGKVMIALPKELSDEQNIALADDIASWFVEKGMIVDVNLHNDRDGNPHMHLQHTGRELVEDRYGNTEFAHVKNREWRGPSYTKSIREFVAERINKHYELAGLSERVSHKSYKELGIDLIPTKHEGPARNIKNSELVELNRQIANLNAEKIKEKPSIILDVLSMNNPVFTKEQIATELEKRLHAGIDFEKITNIEELQSELSGTFIKLYNQIINSPEITCVNESDLKGRALYTTTKRIQLEERFTANIEAMHKVQDHVLGITDKDLDHLSFTEKVSKSVREVKTDAIEYINDKTGLNITKPKKPIVLSKEQREAVIGVVNGSNISVLEGIPGAGKTTTVRQIVRCIKKKDIKLLVLRQAAARAFNYQKLLVLNVRMLLYGEKNG